MKTRILVTGASGFIGRYVLAELREYPIEVIPCARSEQFLEGYHMYPLDFSVLSDRELRSKVKDFACSHLLHLAWSVVPGFWDSRDNLDWVSHSMRLTRAFIDAGGCKIVAAGTCAEYQKEAHLYTVTKLATKHILERACLDAGIRFVWARIAYPYGLHEQPSKFVSSLISKLAVNEPISVREPNKYVDYIHVSDVAQALTTLLFHPKAKGSYNVATGMSITIRQLVEQACQVMESHSPLQWGTLMGEDCHLRVQRLCRLGWQPKITIQEGIEELWRNLTT